jgi:hypothetical protein
MARAWHEGRKAMHRMLMKPQPDHFHKFGDGPLLPQIGQEEIKPRYQPGEIVYIQEPFVLTTGGCFLPAKAWVMIVYQESLSEQYPIDEVPGNTPVYDANEPETWKWRFPVTMPEKFSRSKARIVDVRPERVRGITELGCFREGIEPTSQMLVDDNLAIDRFEQLWETLYPGSWNRNDWVWRCGLEMVEK